MLTNHNSNRCRIEEIATCSLITYASLNREWPSLATEFKIHQCLEGIYQNRMTDTRPLSAMTGYCSTVLTEGGFGER